MNSNAVTQSRCGRPCRSFLSLSLRKKAAVCLIPLVITMSVIYTIQAIRTEHSILKGEMVKKGETIARIAATNAELPILSENLELLRRSASSLMDIKDVAFVEIMGKDLKPLIHEGTASGPPILALSADTVTYVDQPKVLEFFAPVFTVSPKDDIDMFQEPAQQTKREQIGWARIALSKKVMNETARQFVFQGVIFAIIFTLCGIGVLYILIAMAARPIASLVEAVKGVSEGEYHSLPTNGSGDEIGELTAEFNRMSQAIRVREERIREMVEQIQAQNVNLDGLVKERTAQLEEANRELKAMDELKTSFLATVSHELRTPLTSVVGFSAIIQRKLKEHIFPTVDMSQPKVQKAVSQIVQDIDIICAEGERLTALINDVLDLTKLESGKIDWNLQPLAIGSIISRATAATKVLFDEKGIELREDIPEGLPEVTGDRDRLIQVVINLLSNAVKFTERGTVTCRARIDGECIAVSVTDEGIGIAADDLETVFEKFKQVGDTLTEKPRGTGLGLPICRQIIEYHGGQIWVESQVGFGSTFFFTVPLCALANSMKDTRQEHHQHGGHHG